MGRVSEVVLMVMVLTSHYLAAGAHENFLLDECIVHKDYTFATYQDYITLYLTQREKNIELKITVNQGGTDTIQKPTGIVGGKWNKGVLYLSGTPKFENDETPNDTQKMNIKRSEVKIENALFYVGCPENTPNFEINSKGDDKSIMIPRSGEEEENLKMLATENTIIQVSVGEEKRQVCLVEGQTVLENVTNDSPCDSLPGNSIIHLNLKISSEKIEITVNKQSTTFHLNEEDRITFLKEGLTGSLYIVQCFGVCNSVGIAGVNVKNRFIQSPINTVVVVFMIIFCLSSLALAAVLIYINRRQGGRVGVGGKPSHDQPNSKPGDRDALAGTPWTGTGDNTGAVDVINDIYQSFDEVLPP